LPIGEAQTRKLKSYTDQQTEKLAVMVADSFEEAKELPGVQVGIRLPERY
jgi:hypothetical protein